MSRFNKHRDAINALKKIDKDKSKYLIIHYSCESFYDDKSKSSRISAIAVESYATKQTKLFSVNSVAEKKSITDIELNYTQLERTMLREFNKFVEKNKDMTWIHWNMRDGSFGFSAIDHRCAVINVKSNEILDSKKLNLAQLMTDLYGKSYVESPHMSNLFTLNKLKNKDFLTGAEEADAFNNSRYSNLEMSTSTKIYNFGKIIDLATDGDLKVKSSRAEIYGNTVEGWYMYFHDMKHGPIIISFINMIFGAFLGKIFSKILFN